MRARLPSSLQNFLHGAIEGRPAGHGERTVRGATFHHTADLSARNP